jgi:predicted Zn-dependent protease
MSTAKQFLKNLIEDIPENEVFEVIDYISYLKIRREKEAYRELQKASESSLKFWDNDIDDEVWNNV